MQRLLKHYAWDPGAVQDALTRHVVASAGDPGGVLVGDESGFAKKGRRSARVQRQYTGTAGRVENSQVAVIPRRCRAGAVVSGVNRPGAR